MIINSKDYDEKIDDDCKLYKYYSLESFISLITTQTLFFQSIKNWKDIAEGSVYDFYGKSGMLGAKGKADYYLGCSWTLEQPDNDDNKEKNDKSRIELHSQGSALMWDSYCNKAGVRIETTINRVIKLIEDYSEKFNVFRGRVYYNPDDYYDEDIFTDYEHFLFRKRYSFHSESEYRILLLPEKYGILKENIPIHDLSNFIKEIVVYPQKESEQWIAKSLYKLIISYLGINSRISTLYSVMSVT